MVAHSRNLSNLFNSPKSRTLYYSIAFPTPYYALKISFNTNNNWVIVIKKNVLSIIKSYDRQKNIYNTLYEYKFKVSEDVNSLWYLCVYIFSKPKIRPIFNRKIFEVVFVREFYRIWRSLTYMMVFVYCTATQRVMTAYITSNMQRLCFVSVLFYACFLLNVNMDECVCVVHWMGYTIREWIMSFLYPK